MSEGGEARNHDAEVEAAIVRALDELHNDMGLHTRTIVAAKRAALDAVRRSPMTLRADPIGEPMTKDELDRLERSPQGEDHEAGLRQWLMDVMPHASTVRSAQRMVEELVAAYLSRCPSPEHNLESRVSQDHDPGRDD